MEGRTVPIARGAGSRTRGPGRHDSGVLAEIALAPVETRSRSLRLPWRRLPGASRNGPARGRLLVTEAAVVVDAPAQLRGRWRIPWDSVRKAVADDGGRWGYVSEVCRFPVHADRGEGSGQGALIGPLWSQGSSLMPAECAVAELEPVPAQPPNLALILDRRVPAPTMRGANGTGWGRPLPLALVLARVEDLGAARAALAAKLEFDEVDPSDLEHLAGKGN